MGQKSVMRLHGKEKMPYHLLSVGHQMKYIETAWQRKKSSVTHQLLVMG